VTSRSALVGTGVESGTEEADEACSRVDEGESLAIPIRRRCGTTGNDESKQHEPQQESTISHHQSDAPRSSTSSRQPLADDSPGRPDHSPPRAISRTHSEQIRHSRARAAFWRDRPYCRSGNRRHRRR
jgi:hypothetical protein